MAAKLAPLVAAAASGLGATLEEPAVAAISTWLERLETWNARVDLTAARSRPDLVDLMVADALVLAARLPSAARLVDVGAGAGAPGLALALVRPDLRVTLVEPLGKRASFLRSVLGELGRVDVAVDRARADALPTREWDVAVSRAVFPPADWLARGEPLVASGGVVWVLLAQGDPPSRPNAAPCDDVAYVWPLTGAPRRAVAYRV